MCVDLKVRSKVVKYIRGSHYFVNLQTEKTIHCVGERDIHTGTGACSFYNLSREARLVGRMCFSLTGKWYTVISELQPRVFISSLFQTKEQLKENKMREHDLHFLHSDFLYMNSLATLILFIYFLYY